MSEISSWDQDLNSHLSQDISWQNYQLARYGKFYLKEKIAISCPCSFSSGLQWHGGAGQLTSRPWEFIIHPGITWADGFFLRGGPKKYRQSQNWEPHENQPKKFRVIKGFPILRYELRPWRLRRARVPARIVQWINNLNQMAQHPPVITSYWDMMVRSSNTI
jgi:hypothetical protein